MEQQVEQIETNGPSTGAHRDDNQAFHLLRAKMRHLGEMIEDLGQFVCENQLEDHFINYVFRLSTVSKDLNTEISTVENYLDFVRRHNPACLTRNSGYFAVIPDEVTIHVFSYLNEAELSSAACVCREWFSLTSDNTLWKRLYTRNWGSKAAARISSPRDHFYRRPTKPLPLDVNSASGKEQTTTDTDLFDNKGMFKRTGPSTTTAPTRRFTFWRPASVTSTPSMPTSPTAGPLDGSSTSSSASQPTTTTTATSLLREEKNNYHGMWKSLFVNYRRTKRNWDTGKHHLITLTHHKNTVRCVQFDENHNMLTASDDKTVQRLDWDSDKNTYVTKMKLTGHEGGIICMQFDGNQMVTGSRDKTLRLWDLERGKSISIFKNHTGQVWCLQFDKHKIVSGSDDKRLNVWDIRSGKLIADLQGHSWGIGCLQFDDSKVISGAADKTLKVWDLAMMRCAHTLKGHRSSVRCVQFDDTRIVSGSWDNTLKIWDVNTYRNIDTLQGHTNKVMCLQFDESKIISGAQDKTIIVWDLHTGKALSTLHSHTDSLCDLHFLNCMLVTGSRDKTVKVWDFSS